MLIVSIFKLKINSDFWHQIIGGEKSQQQPKHKIFSQGDVYFEKEASRVVCKLGDFFLIWKNWMF
jgi:hypothetical protein